MLYIYRKLLTMIFIVILFGKQNKFSIFIAINQRFNDRFYRECNFVVKIFWVSII